MWNYMTRPESSRQLEGLKPRDVREKYPPGTEVVVNIKGKWQAVKLEEQAVLEDGKIKIVTVNETLHLEELPDIVEFKNGDTITDAGRNFTLENIFITIKGAIEFDVEESGRETTKGVSQEFLKSWDKTTKLEKEIENLSGEIKKISRAKREELKKHVEDLKKISAEIAGNLPGRVSDIASQSDKKVAEVVKIISGLHDKAEKAIDSLKSKIIEAKNAPEDVGVPNLKTKEEKKLAVESEKAEAERKSKMAGLLKKQLDDEIQKTIVQVLEQKKKDKLESKISGDLKKFEKATAEWEKASRQFKTDESTAKLLIVKLENEKKAHEEKSEMADNILEGVRGFVERQAKNRADELKEGELQRKIVSARNHWVRNAPRNARRNPADFPEGNVQLNPEENKRCEQQAFNEIKDEKRAEYFVSLINDNAEILSEVSQRRREKAKKEHLHALLNKQHMDYEDPAAMADATLSVFEKLLVEWKKPYTELDKANNDLSQLTQKYEKEQQKHEPVVQNWEQLQEKNKLSNEELPKITEEAKKEGEVEARNNFIDKIIKNNKDFKAEIDGLRMERASYEPDSSLIKDGDYKKLEQRRVNLELLDEVLKLWEKPETAAESAQAETEIFGFDVEVEKINAELDKLLADLPKSEEGSVKKEFLPLYEELLKFKNDYLPDVIEALSSLKKAKEFELIHSASDTEIESAKALNEEREYFTKYADSELKKFAYKLLVLKTKQSRGEKFEKVAEVSPVDLSSGLIEEILMLKPEKLRVALKQMYEGDAGVAFRGLMPESAPSKIDADTLRRCGIKNWGEFKKLWDSKLAGEVAKSMEEMAKQSLLKKIAEAVTALDQIKAFKGQLATRAGLNALLIGGSSFGLRVLFSEASQLLQDAAVVAGGAGTGVLKWGIFRAIMGEKSGWTKKSNKKLEKAGERKKGGIIDNLVEEMMKGSAMTNATNAPVEEKRGFWSKIFRFKKLTDEDKNILDGMPMISNLMAQTIREATAGKLVVGEGDEKVELKGTARLRYENALASLDVKDIGAENEKKLALVFQEMNGRGEEIQKLAKPDWRYSSIIDKLVNYYSGKGSLKGSMAANAGLASIFAVSGAVRGAFGAAMGAYGGWKFAEMKQLKWEAQEGKVNLAEKMKNVKWFTNNYDVKKGFTAEQKVHFRTDLLYLKRFLHGNVAKEELTAAVKVTAEGSPQLDEMLLGQIESMVYEAESTGILLEKEEDAMKLDAVLIAMSSFNSESTKKEEKGKMERFTKWARRAGMKTTGAVAGGAVGAATYFFGGFLAHKAINGIKGWFGWGGGNHHAVAGVSAAAAGGHEASGYSPVTSGSANEVVGAGSAHESEAGSVELQRGGVEQLTVKNPLSQNTFDELKKLTDDFPQLNNAESLQRIYDASIIGKGVHSSHADFIKGDIDTLEEGGGERRLVVFEEIRKIDPAAAAKYLQEQGFSKQHLSHLSGYIHNGTGEEYTEFAKNYNAHDSKMVKGLFRAMQGRETTDLFKAGLENGKDMEIGLRSGKVSYFGVGKNNEPVLSGDGKVVVTEKTISLAAMERKIHENADVIREAKGAMPSDQSSPKSFEAPETGEAREYAADTTKFTRAQGEHIATVEAGVAEQHRENPLAKVHTRVVKTFEVSSKDAVSFGRAGGTTVEAVGETGRGSMKTISVPDGQPKQELIAAKIAVEQARPAELIAQIQHDFYYQRINLWKEVYPVKDPGEDRLRIGDTLLDKISYAKVTDPAFDAKVQEIENLNIPPAEKMDKVVDLFASKHPLSSEEELFRGGKSIENSDLFKKVRAELDGVVYDNAVVASGSGSNALRVQFDDGSVRFISRPDEHFVSE